jgi:dolichol-phosphate mannosyltransferase
MVSFFVPAYNEQAHVAATVGTIVSAAQAVGLQSTDIIVVDDGSTDHTAEILRGLAAANPSIQVITHPVNRGIGASFRDALAVAKSDHFIAVPGDNDMSFDVLRLLLRHRDSADVVMAFPINIEHRTLARNVISAFYRLAYMVTFRVFVNYINAPCVYPTRKLRDITLRSHRFSIIAEATTKLLRSGCSYTEIPGFFQTMQGHRRTVNMRNLIEVVRSFSLLFFEINFFARASSRNAPKRVFIDLFGAGSGRPAMHEREDDGADQRINQSRGNPQPAGDALL